MSYMSKVFDPKKHKKYVPKNIDKYKGKTYPICRSSLEEAFCKIIDNDRSILEWNSEPFFIEYMFKDQKKHYYPDFVLKIQTPIGIEKKLVEIKHSSETKPPQKGKRKARKTLLNEKFTWQKNQAKWRAANRWCKKMGYKFSIITEKQLFKRE